MMTELTDTDRLDASLAAWAQLKGWLMARADAEQSSYLPAITAQEVLDHMAELDAVRKLGRR